MKEKKATTKKAKAKSTASKSQKAAKLPMLEPSDSAEALAFANTAAGIATEKEGAQAGIPTRAEVENRL